MTAEKEERRCLDGVGVGVDGGYGNGGYGLEVVIVGVVGREGSERRWGRCC